LPEQATIIQRRIKCFGAGESALEAMLPDLIRRGRDPLVGITAHEATITLRIAARGPNEAECREKIAATEVLIRDCLGQLVFGEEDDELEDATLAALAASGATLAIGEAATAGRATSLAAQASHRRFTAGQPGVFRGGLVTAADGTQEAAALAEQARASFGGSVGLGIGSAYPVADGRTAIRFAVATASVRRMLEHVLGGGPDLAASRAAKAALDLVRTLALEARAPA
jgi:nicotinamide-nucleotide amidase